MSICNSLTVTPPTKKQNTHIGAEAVLASIQTKLEDSLSIDCIMEDIKIDIEEVEGENVSILSISYFNLTDENSTTLLGILQQQEINPSTIMLNLGSGGISSSCKGVNCADPCTGETGKTPAGEIIVFSCTGCENAKDPTKGKSCDYETTQRLVSDIVFESFMTNISANTIIE